jgi:competence protein ComEC
LPEDSSLLRQVALKQRCKEGQNWNWDGVQFEILHPEEISYTNNDIKNNNRGCVLRISIENNNVLLTADIEKNSEERLVKLHSDKIKTTLLVVPHHGSKTSSTINFVERSHPRYAVFSAGYRNHFGHPKQEILRRYLNLGSELLRTDIDGAILVDMNDNNIRIEKYRQSHARYWQTQLSQQSQHGLLIE